MTSPATNERSSNPSINWSIVPITNKERKHAFYKAIIAKQMARNQSMTESAFVDSKLHSGTKKSLEARSRISSEASTLEKSDLKMNKVSKMNQVRRSSEYWFMICYWTGNAKGDHANTNKCKVNMISSEVALASTSVLRQRLCQIRQARRTSSTMINLSAKPLCLVGYYSLHQLSAR